MPLSPRLRDNCTAKEHVTLTGSLLFEGEKLVCRGNGAHSYRLSGRFGGESTPSCLLSSDRCERLGIRTDTEILVVMIVFASQRAVDRRASASGIFYDWSVGQPSLDLSELFRLR